MTVAEVIKELQKYPSDMRIVTPGFDEGGLDDVGTVQLIGVRFNDSKGFSHCGRHDEDSINGEKAVLINFLI